MACDISLYLLFMIPKHIYSNLFFILFTCSRNYNAWYIVFCGRKLECMTHGELAVSMFLVLVVPSTRVTRQ
jgi:hypothetical protein